MDEIVETRKREIRISMPIEKNPAAVYLARLGSEHSRCGMRWCLSIASSILTNGRYEFHEIDWTRLRYQHIAAPKARLMQPNPTARRRKPYAFGTANMILCGVRGVMTEARKLGHIQRRLRPEAAYSMLQRRCEDAGVEPISPHDCRRTYIANLMQTRNDLATTAKPAGHKSVDKTARYDRRGINSLRAAAESLVLPC